MYLQNLSHGIITKPYRWILILILSVIVISCSTKPVSVISSHYRQYLEDSLSTGDIPESQDSLALELFLQGAAYEQQGLYADAIVDYLDAYRYDSSAVILYAIGKNYMKIYKYERAEEYLLAAIGSDSTLIQALEALSQCYIKSFRRDEAIKALEELVSISPKERYIFNLAYLYEFSDIPKSIKLYEKLQQSQNDNLILNKLSQLYLQTGDTVNYVTSMEKAYQKSRDDAETIQELFSSYVLTKQYQKASNLIDTTDMRLTTDELAILYVGLGADLSKLRDENSNGLRKHFLSKINSRFYFDWQLASITGLIALTVGDSVKGEEMMEKAISLNDTIPDLILDLGNYYIEAKKTDKAIKLLSEYKPVFKNDSRFAYMIGYAYLSDEKYTEARDICLEVLASDTRNSAILTQLGIIYDRMKMIDSSDYYYIQSLIVNPDDALANNNFAYSLSLRRKELDKALVLSRKSLESDSTNSSYLDTYGWILNQLGRYPDAVEYLNKAIDTGEATAEVYEHLGDVYMNMGDKGKAVSSWELGILIEPNNPILLDKIKKHKP